MTDYEIGRVYSAEYPAGKRELFIWTGPLFEFVGVGGQDLSAPALTGIRGPLIVLDEPSISRDDWRIIADHLRERLDEGEIADQIDAQTAPPASA